MSVWSQQQWLEADLCCMTFSMWAVWWGLQLLLLWHWQDSCWAWALEPVKCHTASPLSLLTGHTIRSRSVAVNRKNMAAQGNLAGCHKCREQEITEEKNWKVASGLHTRSSIDNRLRNAWVWVFEKITILFFDQNKKWALICKCGQKEKGPCPYVLR